eukprot:m.146321 g.146321  ORF g.146321 m.146321 type:complete len:58 (-) comp117158_c0_seq1:13-186(-)
MGPWQKKKKKYNVTRLIKRNHKTQHMKEHQQELQTITKGRPCKMSKKRKKKKKRTPS